MQLFFGGARNRLVQDMLYYLSYISNRPFLSPEIGEEQ